MGVEPTEERAERPSSRFEDGVSIEVFTTIGHPKCDTLGNS